MIELIRQTEPTARKEHRCDACEFLLQDLCSTVGELTFSEKRDVVKARRNSWKIKKGQKYINQVCKYDDIYTVKAIPEIHAICLKYGLYEH